MVEAFFNKRQLNDAMFYSAHYRIGAYWYMLAIGWGIGKRNWWYDKDPETAKFLWWSSEPHYKTVHIGKLGLCYMRSERDGKTHSRV